LINQSQGSPTGNFQLEFTGRTRDSWPAKS